MCETDKGVGVSLRQMLNNDVFGRSCVGSQGFTTTKNFQYKYIYFTPRTSRNCVIVLSIAPYSHNTNERKSGRIYKEWWYIRVAQPGLTSEDQLEKNCALLSGPHTEN